MHWDFGVITSSNVLIVAYSFQQSLFPTYNSLGANKNNKHMKRSINIGVAITAVVYICLGVLSIFSFGSALTSDVFDAVGDEDTIYSIIIRFAFLIVLACHIPFVFLPTKEGFLILIDEAQNHSMQIALDN